MLPIEMYNQVLNIRFLNTKEYLILFQPFILPVLKFRLSVLLKFKTYIERIAEEIVK